MKKGLIFIIYFFIISLPAHAIAKEELTMKKALELFYKNNLEIEAARQKIRASEAEEAIAGQLTNPVFGIEWEEINDKKTFYKENEQRYFIEQLIETGGKRSLRIDKARLQIREADAQRGDLVRNLIFEIKSNFIDALKAKEKMGILRAMIEDISRHIDQTKLKVKEGYASEKDVIEAEIIEAGLQNSLTGVEEEYILPLSRLKGLLFFDVEFDIKEERLEFQSPKSSDKDELIRKVLLKRHDLKARRLMSRNADMSLSQVKAERMPDITVMLHLKRTEENKTFGFGIKLPLPLFNRNDGQILKAERELSVAMLEEKNVERKIINEVEGALKKYNAKFMAMKGHEKALQKIERFWQMSHLSFEEGAIDLSGLLAAERIYKEAKLSYIDTYYDTYKAHIELEKTIGAGVE